MRRLATRIVELDRGQLRVWPGSYDDYVLQKRAALEVEAKHAALFDKKLAQEEVWIRQGVEARRTRNEGRVRALKQLRIQRAERRERIGQVEIRAQDAAPSGKLVFEAVHVTHTFGGPPVIADFSARIQRLDRIGIIGPNGCGKTTLIKLLVGDLEPTSGEIRRDVSGYLRDFLFPPERLRAPVSMLSGGERNRLLLARLFARPSNLLVMDEPTNDLDADTLELLEEMVANYAGTLLLVSHDRAFLDNVVTSTLVFEGGAQVNEYVGGYSDWLRQRRAVDAAAPASARAASAATEAAPSDAAPARSRARRLSYKEQRELEALPEKIQLLEAEQLELQAAIADPALFRGPVARGTAALQRLQSLAAEIETAYSRWHELES